MTLAETIHQAILDTLRVERGAAYERAKLVRRLSELRLYRQLGYPSLAAYGRDVLGIGATKLKALLFLARRAEGLPALEEALTSGRLSWTKGVLVARVATPETEKAWVDRAVHTSSRELEQQVQACMPGDPPPDPDEVGPPRVWRHWRLEVADAEVADRVIALLRSETGLIEGELDDGRLVGLAFRRVARALEDETDNPPTEPVYRTVVTRCPDCAQAFGPDRPIMDHVAAAAEDDAEELDLTAGPDRGKVTRHVPARLRRAVLARDGHRCVFPGCSCSLWLHVHHGEPFARAPRHVEEDLFTLCSAHHAALHEGHVGLFQDRRGAWMVVHKRGLVEPARVGCGEPSKRSHVRPPQAAAAGETRATGPP